MDAHIAHDMHSLGLDKILGAKKVELNRRERDLILCEAVLVEVKSRGLNPRDNHEKLMDFVKLQKLLKDVEVGHVTEAEWLAILARDVSKDQVDLGMPPIPRIPQDPHTVSDVLMVVGIILERLQEAYTSGNGPWDQAQPTVLHMFLVFLILLLICKILQGLTVSGVSTCWCLCRHP
jgi:hypothetical protein